MRGFFKWIFALFAGLVTSKREPELFKQALSSDVSAISPLNAKEMELLQELLSYFRITEASIFYASMIETFIAIYNDLSEFGFDALTIFLATLAETFNESAFTRPGNSDLNPYQFIKDTTVVYKALVPKKYQEPNFWDSFVYFDGSPVDPTRRIWRAVCWFCHHQSSTETDSSWGTEERAEELYMETYNLLSEANRL